MFQRASVTLKHFLRAILSSVLFCILCNYLLKVSDTVPQDPSRIGAGITINAAQLTWLALDEDQVARSRRVEQLIALRGL